MCAFKTYFIIFLHIIVLVESERWYSATMIERRGTDNISGSNNYLQVNEHQFTPLQLLHPKEMKTKRHDFRPSLYPFETPQRSQNSSFKNAVVIQYNNSISNANVLKNMQPKRKRIRKRCPAVRSKHSKQLGSKQPSRTRFLEVFQVVEFEHVPCTSSSGLEGTCFPEYECTEAAGATMGSCADGYGTCCVSKFIL